MMGSGYRAHRLFNEIRPALDAIDRNLFPLYERVMGNMEFYLWTIEFNPKQNLMGTCKINKSSMQGEASATIFLILLHETAKIAVELVSI